MKNCCLPIVKKRITLPGRCEALSRNSKGRAGNGPVKIEFKKRQGQPMISGIELIANGLELGQIPTLDKRELRAGL